MLRFRCPHCDIALKTGDRAAGKTFACPACSGRVVITDVVERLQPEQLASEFERAGSQEETIEEALPVEEAPESTGITLRWIAAPLPEPKSEVQTAPLPPQTAQEPSPAPKTTTTEIATIPADHSIPRFTPLAPPIGPIEQLTITQPAVSLEVPQPPRVPRGWVYILMNSSLPGLVKIGQTKLTPEERARQVSAGTGVPLPYTVVHAAELTYFEEAEREIHEQLAKVRENPRREFFRLSAKEAIAVVEEVAERFRAREREEIARAEQARLARQAMQSATAQALSGQNATSVPIPHSSTGSREIAIRVPGWQAVELPKPAAKIVQPESGPAISSVTGPASLPVAQTQDDKSMAMYCHLLGAFLGLIGALVIWLVVRDRSKFVDDQGKEAVSFQILVIIAHLIGGATVCFTFGIINLIVFVLGLIFGIIAGFEANRGVAYRYPLSLRRLFN